MEIVRITTTALIIISVSWTIGNIGLYLRTEHNKKHYDQVLKVPKLIFWIGLVGLIVCYIIIACILIFSYNEQSVAAAIALFVFSLVYVYIIMYALNWKIEVNRDVFVYRNMFRKVRVYQYSDIEAIKRIKIGGYKLVLKKKKIYVDYYILNSEILWNKIKSLNIAVQ